MPHTDTMVGFLRVNAERSEKPRKRVPTEVIDSYDYANYAPYEPGTILHGHHDNYTVVRALGGASGSYKVTDTDGITFFAKAYDQGTDSLRNFWHIREQQAAKAVGELGISSPVVDWGHKRPLLVLPFVEGKTLYELIKKHAPFDAPDVRRISLPLAQRLAIAHNAHWVHRDIKGDNIIYDKKDKQHALPLINDWGYAFNTELHKHEKHCLGTPRYKSPEQIIENGVADARSDIYSLGIVLHELLTRTNPRRHLKEQELKKPPTLPYDPTDTMTTADKRLAWIIMRATQPDPARRYQSCEELVEDLKSKEMYAVQQ